MKIKSSSVCSGRRKSQARAWFIELRIREEPEIDGIIKVSSHLPVGGFANVKIVEAIGTDVLAI